MPPRAMKRAMVKAMKQAMVSARAMKSAMKSAAMKKKDESSDQESEEEEEEESEGKDKKKRSKAESELESAEESSDEEEDTNRSQIDHPSRNGHHSIRQAGEEVQQRFAPLSNVSQSHSQDDSKEDKAKDVGSISPFSFESPGERVVGVPPLTVIFKVRGTILVTTLGLDESSPVLLHGGLDQIGRNNLANEVHQGVRCVHIARIQCLVPLH